MKIETKKLLIILITFLAVCVIYFYNNSSFYVIIRFDELGALTKNMAAYYNGFKIGKIVRIQPDNDFKHTLVKVNLIYKDIKLPQNTTVHVQNFPNGELYLEFLYPDSPSFKILKRGELLEGIAPYSLEQFMLGQNISGVSDIVSLHVIRALKATEIANIEMTNFFKNTSKLVKENSDEIQASTRNAQAMTKSLAQMADNLNQTAKKLNEAIDSSTIKDSTINIKTTTENISKATKDLDKTMKKVDETVAQVQATSENLNSITSGVNETLGKKFGGMRLMFGKPVSRKSAVKNACN